MHYKFDELLKRLQEIKSLRKLRNEDISRKSNIPIGTLSKIFAGITTDPKIGTLISIADALDISVDYLIYGTTTSFNNDEKELIKKYRQLNADGKERINNMLDVEIDQLRRKEMKQSENKVG